MKVFTEAYLNKLITCARASKRMRQHGNIHDGYNEACQRLFNAIEPGSYIRPHKHTSDPKDEMLIAIRGVMALITFDCQGSVIESLRFGSEASGTSLAIGIEVPANTWHTVIALESGSVLLEVKAGPFNPLLPKDLAPWAPEEGSTEASAYLRLLIESV